KAGCQPNDVDRLAGRQRSTATVYAREVSGFFETRRLSVAYGWKPRPLATGKASALWLAARLVHDNFWAERCQATPACVFRLGHFLPFQIVPTIRRVESAIRARSSAG